MAQPSPMFTAAEVLRAGLQAEAEGRLDYAVQFFRHLTDHHAHTPEAADARVGLQRIAHRRGEGAHGEPPRSQPPQQSQNGFGQGPPPQPAAAGRAPAGGAIVTRAAAQAMQPSATNAVATTTQTAAHTPLPAPERRYLVGRVIAGVLQVLGWVLAVLGLLLLGLGMVIGGNLPVVPKLGSTFVTGPALLIAGCLLVFWGQLARALFDAANAARDLAAIERAKADSGGRPAA